MHAAEQNVPCADGEYPQRKNKAHERKKANQSAFQQFAIHEIGRHSSTSGIELADVTMSAVGTALFAVDCLSGH
jgi:hypothetical protein